MKIDWKFIVIVCVIIAIILGFLFGTGRLGADTKKAGSADDPLMSSSAVSETIDTRVATLEAEIELLTEQVSNLETTINQLTGAVSGSTTTTTTTTTPAATTPAETTTTTTTPADTSSSNVGKTGNVTADVVNLRSSSSTSSTIVKKLSPSDSFTITKIDGSWYQVQLVDGTTGWIRSDLVKLN